GPPRARRPLALWRRLGPPRRQGRRLRLGDPVQRHLQPPLPPGGGVPLQVHPARRHGGPGRGGGWGQRLTPTLAATYHGPMAESATLTPAIQEYLESLYWLGEAGIERTPTNLARAMQVSPPSVTGMVRRLEAEGLVARGPGKRIVLTDPGMEGGKHVGSRHRLVEAFLVKVMGIPWDEVHEEAEAFEMGVTPALEARMLDMI